MPQFGDIGTGDEGASGADQDDGIDLGVRVEGVRGIPEGLAERLGQGVDGRIVDGDDGDAAPTVDGEGHGQVP